MRSADYTMRSLNFMADCFASGMNTAEFRAALPQARANLTSAIKSNADCYGNRNGEDNIATALAYAAELLTPGTYEVKIVQKPRPNLLMPDFLGLNARGDDLGQPGVVA